jgi:hypothetical protein
MRAALDVTGQRAHELQVVERPCTGTGMDHLHHYRGAVPITPPRLASLALPGGSSPHGALPRLLSYVFRAATVGGSVNLIAGLIRSISAVRKAVCIRPPRPLLAECEYVGLDAGCEEGYLEGAVVN